MAPIFCPRCGHADSFITGFLPDTCVCLVCQSQLDWREIPGIGSDCRPSAESDRPEVASGDVPAAARSSSSPVQREREQE